MEEEREQILGHILAIDRRLYDYLQLVRIPDWAEVELTMPQWKVLFLAGGPRPLSTSHVARTLGMTVSTATGVVDRLVAQRLVARKEDPSDRRIVLLQATPEGRAFLERLLSAGLCYFREILDCLSLEELRTVSSAMDILHRTAISLTSSQLLAVNNQLPRTGEEQAEGSQAYLQQSRPKPANQAGPPITGSATAAGGRDANRLTAES